jgi:hypothetical protein
MDKKEILKIINAIVDRHLIYTTNVEKNGIRNYWLIKGLQTGTFLGTAIFSKKYRLISSFLFLSEIVGLLYSSTTLDKEEFEQLKKFAVLKQNMLSMSLPEKKGPIN